MRMAILIAITALLSISPVAGLAGGQKGCPPGLAKKQNGCLPPGQANKIYGRGDYLDGDDVLIRQPGRYGLQPDQTYYRLGDYVYRVDRDTKEILDLVGAISAILD